MIYDTDQESSALNFNDRPIKMYVNDCSIRAPAITENSALQYCTNSVFVCNGPKDGGDWYGTKTQCLSFECYFVVFRQVLRLFTKELVVSTLWLLT